MKRTAAHAIALALVASLAGLLGCAHDPRPDEDRIARVSSHYDLGVDYLKGGNTAMALRELQAALALDERQPRVHHAIAEAYRLTGRFSDAERHLRRSLELNPAFQGARLSLSALYVQMERYEEAVRESASLAEDPTFPAPWRALTNAGWAQIQLGRTEEARATLTRALAMRSDYWPALLDLGILASQTGRRAEAIEVFSRVLAAKPGPSAEAETNYRMAEIYVSMGDRDRALAHLATVIERQGTSEWGRRSQEYRKLLQ
ncbi:MAG: tetratricopeptide repeat protein [Deltaproteobacteria bacterium]|nr:tetratricopeptide repeat protein [Deltaproteobacteria bacterium]